MQIRTLAVNALVAALYIVVTFFLMTVSFQAVQFRIAEMLNHLVIFNKKYFFGIIAGVFIGNLFYSPLGMYDLIFGLGQSVISLLIIMILSLFIKNKWVLMMLNTALFSLTSFLIAWELYLAFHAPLMFSWVTVAAGECAVMLVGAPIMYYIDRRLDLKKQL